MIDGLDHVNVETLDLDSSIHFYTEVLGLEVGPRPPFGVPGAWFYTQGHPIVHLVQREKVNPSPTGAIHHVALKATGLEDCKTLLNKEGIEYTATLVPDLNVTQLFINDPNGVVWELNFYQNSN